MKQLLLSGFLLCSGLLFAQENVTAYYQYKTSSPGSKLGMNGVSIIYELNKKGNEANFEIKKGDKFYDGQIYNYVNLENNILETQRNYKGNRAIVFSTINKIDWIYKDETKEMNQCNAKRADYEYNDGKLIHVVEVWYCPSDTHFSPISSNVPLFDLPGYVLSYKETLNNKAKMVTEYNLLEFKENNSIQIKKPNEGERIDYKDIDKGFTTSAN